MGQRYLKTHLTLDTLAFLHELVKHELLHHSSMFSEDKKGQQCLPWMGIKVQYQPLITQLWNYVCILHCFLLIVVSSTADSRRKRDIPFPKCQYYFSKCTESTSDKILLLYLYKDTFAHISLFLREIVCACMCVCGCVLHCIAQWRLLLLKVVHIRCEPFSSCFHCSLYQLFYYTTVQRCWYTALGRKWEGNILWVK